MHSYSPFGGWGFGIKEMQGQSYWLFYKCVIFVPDYLTNPFAFFDP